MGEQPRIGVVSTMVLSGLVYLGRSQVLPRVLGETHCQQSVLQVDSDSSLAADLAYTHLSVQLVLHLAEQLTLQWRAFSSLPGQSLVVRHQWLRGHDDSLSRSVEALPAGPTYHLFHLLSRVLLVTLGLSSVAAGGLDDHQISRQVHSLGQSARRGQHTDLLFQECRLDHLSILGRETRVVERHSCLHESSQLSVLYLGLEASVSLAVHDQLLGRQDCALLGLAEHQTAFTLTVTLDHLMQFVVQFLFEQVLVLARTVPVDGAAHWH